MRSQKLSIKIAKVGDGLNRVFNIFLRLILLIIFAFQMGGYFSSNKLVL